MLSLLSASIVPIRAQVFERQVEAPTDLQTEIVFTHNSQHNKLSFVDSILSKNNSISDKIQATVNTTIDRTVGSNNSNVDWVNYVNVEAWPVLFLSIFVVFGFVGNMLVCLAITLDSRLQNATNFYLFSLATTDLLVSVIVIPLAIIKSFLKEWILGDVVCTLWIFFDVFLCTTSIMLLCVIACERYIGIKDPLKNRDRSKSKTRSIIIAIWTISSLLSCPVLFLAYVDRHNILLEGNCALQNSHFIISGSIVSFLFPLVVMIVVYCLTVKRLHKVVKNFKLKEGNRGSISASKEKEKPKLPFKLFARFALKQQQAGQESQNFCPKEAVNKRNSFVGLRRSVNSNSSAGSNRVNGTSPMALFLLRKAIRSESQKSSETKNSSVSGLEVMGKLNSKFLTVTTQPPRLTTEPVAENDSTGAEANTGNTGAKRFAELVNKRRLVSRAVKQFQTTRETNRVKNEQKAVKVLGVVLVVFVIAWVPFAIANILSAVCDLTARCSIPPSVLSTLTWLGYISSCINPLIYNAISERFRFAFKQILTCRWHALKKRQLVAATSTNSKLTAAKLTAQEMLLIQQQNSPRLSNLRHASGQNLNNGDVPHKPTEA